MQLVKLLKNKIMRTSFLCLFYLFMFAMSAQANSRNFVVNQQIVDRIYYATLARDIDEFTPEQVSGLEDIVWQCPYIGGEAVYFARSLYALINDTLVFNDDSLCLLQNVIWRQGQINNIIDNKEVVKFYPNPAQDKLNIESKLLEGTQANLLIYNTLGELVANYPLISEVSQYALNISQLPSGVYSCKLLARGGIVTTYKLIIVK